MWNIFEVKITLNITDFKYNYSYWLIYWKPTERAYEMQFCVETYFTKYLSFWAV